MTDKREVTEQDLRLPEFRDAKLEDLEFRDDGKVVRKDRFKVALYSIASKVGFGSRSGFECPEVVNKVQEIVEQHELFTRKGWVIQNNEGLFLEKVYYINFISDFTKVAFFDDKSEAEHCIKDNPKHLKGCFIKFAKARIAFDITDAEPEDLGHAE